MYKIATKNKRIVGIAQTGKGWNVSTFRVRGKRVHTFRTQNTRTLAMAKKAFTKQKRKYLK